MGKGTIVLYTCLGNLRVPRSLPGKRPESEVGDVQHVQVASMDPEVVAMVVVLVQAGPLLRMARSLVYVRILLYIDMLDI